MQFATVGSDEHTQKGAKSPRLDVEIPCRTDQPSKFRFREREHPLRVEHASRFQIRDGTLDVGPTRVLGKNRTNANFERRFAGPPLLMAEALAHEFVGATQLRRLLLTS